MAIELLGGRILAPYFGSSIHVWGSIITVFMLALSVGYLLGGWWSMRKPALGRLALIFLLAGLAVLPLLLAGETLLGWVFEHVKDPRYGSLLASMLLFMLPTVLLGMVSPYTVRLLVSLPGHSGRVAGTLYFLSTIGSALGTLSTAFYLVLWFEVRSILVAVVVVLMACALLAWLAARMEAHT